VRRWIAEGYARDTDKMFAEERGEQFFCGLLDLSIIMQKPHSVTTAFSDRRMTCAKSTVLSESISYHVKWKRTLSSNWEAVAP